MTVVEPVSVAADVRRLAKEKIVGKIVGNCRNMEVQDGTAPTEVPTVGLYDADALLQPHLLFLLPFFPLTANCVFRTCVTFILPRR